MIKRESRRCSSELAGYDGTTSGVGRPEFCRTNEIRCFLRYLSRSLGPDIVYWGVIVQFRYDIPARSVSIECRDRVGSKRYVISSFTGRSLLVGLPVFMVPDDCHCADELLALRAAVYWLLDTFALYRLFGGKHFAVTRAAVPKRMLVDACRVSRAWSIASLGLIASIYKCGEGLIFGDCGCYTYGADSDRLTCLCARGVMVIGTRARQEVSLWRSDRSLDIRYPGFRVPSLFECCLRSLVAIGFSPLVSVFGVGGIMSMPHDDVVSLAAFPEVWGICDRDSVSVFSEEAPSTSDEAMNSCLFAAVEDVANRIAGRAMRRGRKDGVHK